MSGPDSLDAAIVSIGPDEVPDGLEVEVVTDEAIEAAVCGTDPLAKRSKIRLADLRDRALIALPVGAASGISSTRPAPVQASSPRIAFEASTPLALADLAERGLGVAIVPASVPRGRAALHALAFVPELRGGWCWRGGPAARSAPRPGADR